MSDELKPCPFCGREAELRFAPSIGGDNKADTSMASAACLDFRCATVGYDKTERVISRWNNRALPPKITGGE